MENYLVSYLLLLLSNAMVFFDKLYQLLNDLVVCYLWSSMIRPRQVIKHNYLSYFLIIRSINNFQLSSDQILHKTFAWNQNQLYLFIVFFEIYAFTYFWGPVLITLNFTMLLRFCKVNYQSRILLKNHPPKVFFGLR